MERKSSCFLPRYLFPYKNSLGFIVEKKKSLRIRGEVLPGSHCDCFPSTYTDITLKDRQAGGGEEQYEASTAHPKQARDIITDIGGRAGGGSLFFVLFFRGKREKRQEITFLCHPFIFQDFYARIAGFCFSVIVVVVMICMK